MKKKWFASHNTSAGSRCWNLMNATLNTTSTTYACSVELSSHRAENFCPQLAPKARWTFIAKFQWFIIEWLWALLLRCELCFGPLPTLSNFLNVHGKNHTIVHYIRIFFNTCIGIIIILLKNGVWLTKLHVRTCMYTQYILI